MQLNGNQRFPHFLRLALRMLSAWIESEFMVFESGATLASSDLHAKP